jgi:uncharacterized protein involved in type VI secretion and phage assembly
MSRRPSFSHSTRQRLYGTYPALVTDVADPDDQGRVEVRLPWIDESEGRSATRWARLATLMAGGERGSWVIPEVDDEVLVAFMAGDPSRPVVVGALWNGVDAPPEQMDAAGSNDVRSFTSRAGHQLRFVDATGDERVELLTDGGHQVIMDDGTAEITVRHSKGTTIRINASGDVSVDTPTQVSIKAPSGVEVQTSKVKVDAPISVFSGVVKAETVVTNAVISSLYKPGVGNLL